MLNQLEALGEQQTRLGFEGETVTPKQLLGIEINERAAALAELVLWIGYLQWHIRTFGNSSVAEPVIHDYGNIEHRDAVLAYDGQEPMLDAAGKLVTRWDGKTFKLHPVTAEKVPDEAAVVVQWRYLNPRAADWPAAEFIVGNPPFLGKGKVRDSLGSGYVEALRGAWPLVPDSADFVAYWWHHSATLVSTGRCRSFGLITTNSMKQAFNRRVVEAALQSRPPIHIGFVIPDHPWVDNADGASVRIAMTVVRPGLKDGVHLRSVRESPSLDGEVTVLLDATSGVVHADLRVGANLAVASRLQSNLKITNTGYILGGRGFVLTAAERAALLLESGTTGLTHALFNGDDLVSAPRGFFVIDCHGLAEDELRTRCPAVWQVLRDKVFPKRQVNPDPRVKSRWWLFRRSNEQLRAATSGLRRFIATPETAKHRIFVFLPGSSRPEHRLVVTAIDDALMLGHLSSSVHKAWALAAGGTLEDRPVYNKSLCFEPFPFPAEDSGLSKPVSERIRTLAEHLDAHRKTQQAAHPELTLTGMYNVLEKLRTGEPLTAKDKLIHTQGLVSVLKSLHDELDAAVLAAYGWTDLQSALADHTQPEARAAAVETLLERLVALNAKRSAEEAAGTVRWLRPDFQQRGLVQQGQMDVSLDEDTVQATAAAAAAPVARRPWPVGLAEQIKAVADVMTASPRPLSLDDLAACFTARGRWRDRLPTILDTLDALGRVRRPAPDRWQGV